MRKLFARHPAHRDEHLDDDQRDRDVAARALPGGRRGAEPRPVARGGRRASSPGTTQNDIIKEYLSRGTYVFPPEHSLRLISRRDRLHGPPDPEVEPDQHLQLPPAGGRRDADAGARLRAVHRDRRARRRSRTPARSPRTTSRRSSAGSRSSSTPASGSSRRCARCAPSSSCGTRSPASGTASRTPKMRRFRYGVQVNSLGLTEAQPENNVQRIVLEMLGVTLSKNARARAVQLPAWNEALGLPAAVGPAVVAAAAAGAGLRVRPAGVRRHLRRLARDRGQGRRAGRRRHGRDRPGPGDGRRDRRGRVRLHEGGAGQLARRPPRPDRVRRGEDRRGQQSTRPPSRRR